MGPRRKSSTIFHQSRGFQPVGFVSFGGWTTLSRGSPKTTGKQIFTLRLTTVAKLQTWSRDENNCYVWGHQNMRNCWKEDSTWKAAKGIWQMTCWHAALPRDHSVPITEASFHSRWQLSWTHNWTMSRQRGTVEHAAPDGVSSSDPSSQGSEMER